MPRKPRGRRPRGLSWGAHRLQSTRAGCGLNEPNRRRPPGSSWDWTQPSGDKSSLLIGESVEWQQTPRPVFCGSHVCCTALERSVITSDSLRASFLAHTLMSLILGAPILVALGAS